MAAPTGLETGVVQSVNLGYTVLKTDDNRQIVVPSSLIASQTIINKSGETGASSVAWTFACITRPT